MAEPQSTFNINIGILGHVDSGKTSLARVLSNVISTAALDKHPQSQERGITLDLGFSAFTVPMPPHLSTTHDQLQCTLVDCPGHASLIRTIIAGASIIDTMILVIDCQQGVQTQTAECIVIGELLIRKRLVVALNKVDLITPEKLTQMTERLRKMFTTTQFAGEVVIVPVAAAPREGEPTNIDSLIAAVINSIETLPDHSVQENLYYAIDHCFPLKGKGTVLTGTILNGAISVGQDVEIANLKVIKKVKSMQSFHQDVQAAQKGDRVAICVTQFDSKQLERGVVCTPNTSQETQVCIIRPSKIRYYKSAVKTKSKYHITIGNETVMGQCTFFSCPSGEEESKTATTIETAHGSTFSQGVLYEYEDELPLDQANRTFFALLELERPVFVTDTSLLIGSKLDADINTKACRLAFHGTIEVMQTSPTYEFVKIAKEKTKTGEIDRVTDTNMAVAKNMFGKQTDIDKFIGMKVDVNGHEAVIESTFGKSGKFKLHFPNNDACPGTVTLRFKRCLFDRDHNMLQ